MEHINHSPGHVSLATASVPLRKGSEGQRVNEPDCLIQAVNRHTTGLCWSHTLQN